MDKTLGETTTKKLFEAAMRRALESQPHLLDEIALKAVQLAADGKSWAMTMVRDTLDGKPTESVHVEQQVTFVNVPNANTLRDKLRDSMARRGLTPDTVQ